MDFLPSLLKNKLTILAN